MKNVLTCLFLVSLSVLVRCDAGKQNVQIKVESTSGGAKVKCPDGYDLYRGDNNVSNVLKYQDDNSGEYKCKSDDETVKIFVKFRTCDNCVELDIASMTGLIVGNVVATFIICVSIYIIAKNTPTGTTAPSKKGSDKQHLVPNEMSNDDNNYQRLRPRNGQRDVYDVLVK